MAVTNIMHTDSFYTGLLHTVFHLMVEKALGIGEQSVIRLKPIAAAYISTLVFKTSGIVTTRLLLGVLGGVMTSLPFIR